MESEPRSRWLSALLVALSSALSSCSQASAPGQAAAGPSGSAQSASAPASSAVLRAELRRDANAITEDELLATDDTRREAAVRALARIQDERSFEALGKALSDERPSIIAWAAFGLGQACRTREPEAVRKLVLRAATLVASRKTAGQDVALRELSLGLGRCGTDEAERSLRAWLRSRPELAEPAALGLSQVARRRKRLDDASIAALLDAAAKEPRGSYFHPLESLPALGGPARQRLLEVARPVLERATPERAFAIRALARAGAEATPALGQVLGAAAASDAERADAARSLAALGEAGQGELGQHLRGLARSLIDGKSWQTAQHGVLLTVLESLEPKSADPGVLAELAQLPLQGDPPPLLRRKIMVRCRAAALLAGRASLSGTLLACDPSPPAERREGELALLRVLGRGSLAKGRGARFRELAKSADRVVREAALELLMAHDEVVEAPELLASALAAKEAGVQATAAKVLARYPARAQPPESAARGAVAPAADARVVQALTSQLGGVATHNNIELASVLLDAATSLQLLGAKPALEQACGSANPTLREHAERGLIALGDAARRCASVAGSGELGPAPSRRLRFEVETDAGTFALTLWGDESPFAVERLAELGRAGFYEGQVVHRVVPGFVVQFGDPDGDGFGGPDRPPLRDQLGPEPFDVGSVGIALAGRDTGSSQLFITLRRAPHLDGNYTLIGQAEPGWERLAPGDRILKVRILEDHTK